MPDQRGGSRGKSPSLHPQPDLEGLDRTELLRLVAEGRQAQAKLEQIGIDLVARTLEAEAAIVAKTRFLSSITHELRTPLHTILGYVGLVIGECSGETRRQLEIVERSGNRLLKLINDLIEYNSLHRLADALQPEPVSFDALLAQLRQAGAQHAASNNATFSLTVSGSLPDEVETDEGRLFQVLDNLVSNACKYASGGKVCLAIDCGATPEGVANADRDCCRLYFSVQDTGLGIPANELHAIFMPFGRASNVNGYPGMGLGLAIARQWVEAMGGKLEVVSELGKGSRFYFSIDVPVISEGEDPSRGAGLRAGRPWPASSSLAPLSPAGNGQEASIPAPRNVAHGDDDMEDSAAALDLELPPESLAHFRDMVDQGRVIRLAQWAETQATIPGSNRALLIHIARVAREADLPALRRLVATLRDRAA